MILFGRPGRVGEQLEFVMIWVKYVLLFVLLFGSQSGCAQGVIVCCAMGQHVGWLGCVGYVIVKDTRCLGIVITVTGGLGMWLLGLHRWVGYVTQYVMHAAWISDRLGREFCYFVSEPQLFSLCISVWLFCYCLHYCLEVCLYCSTSISCCFAYINIVIIRAFHFLISFLQTSLDFAFKLFSV